MVDWASPNAVRQAITRWSNEQITCRTYGHNWTPRTVFHRPGIYTISQVCARCRNERWRDMDEGGGIITSWRMNYREGYLLTGLGRVGPDGRNHLRLASLDGLTIQEVNETGD